MLRKTTAGDEIMLSLRVLGYMTEDRQWAAHCLETDLVGYGKTFDSAVKHLQELTEMQVSFSFFKNQPALLDRPAPPQIFELYNRLFRLVLEHYNKKSPIDSKHRIGSVPLPERPRKGLKACFVPT